MANHTPSGGRSENSVDAGEAEGYHMGAAVGAASHYRLQENGVIRMYFVDPRSASEELNVSGAMSALKPTIPSICHRRRTTKP